MRILYAMLALIFGTTLGWAAGVVPDWVALELALMPVLVTLYVDGAREPPVQHEYEG